MTFVATHLEAQEERVMERSEHSHMPRAKTREPRLGHQPRVRLTVPFFPTQLFPSKGNSPPTVKAGHAATQERLLKKSCL